MAATTTTRAGRAAAPALLLAALLLAAPAAAAAAAASSVVSNTAPRVDATTGAILDIHDGVTIRVGDTFYWYGASYGGCVEQPTGCASIAVGKCGFNLNHSVALATSTDLVSWSLVGDVLPPAARPPGILFSPTVARSAATGNYVLWVNILPVVNGSGDFDASFYAAFTAPSPAGPFTLAVANVTGIGYTRLPDAPYLFVDPATGAGYVAFTHEDTHVNHVQALSADLLGPAIPGGGMSSQIGPGNNEGVVMFAVPVPPAAGGGTRYYVGFGACCCFCAAGANVDLYVSPSPLGPYAFAGTAITPGAWRAQTGAVWFTGAQWVLYGDRWQSAPDRIKGHDFSFMTPLAFAPDGSVLPITAWQDNVTIQY
jgi:hypothetical protein